MTWAIEDKSYSQRRACALVGLHPKTYRYASTRPDDLALRAKLRELASQRRRFGYRRLGRMLERPGIKLNAKKLYRLYQAEAARIEDEARNLFADNPHDDMAVLIARVPPA